MGIALKSIRAYLDHHNVKAQAKRAAAKPNDVEAKPEGNAAARPEAKRKAKRHAKAKAVGIPDAEGPR